MSRKTDEAAAHQENAERLAQVDVHRALVPCSVSRVMEGMSAAQITATCRIYGLKVDTEKNAVLERILVRLSAGPIYNAADIDDWANKKGVRRRADVAEDLFPDFKEEDDTEEFIEDEAEKTLEQILAEAESGEAPLKKRKVVQNEEPKDSEVVLRKKKLALRAQKLIDAMKLTQVPVNMEMAGEFDEETKKMVEGKVDDVEFFEQLLLGEQAMQKEWPGMMKNKDAKVVLEEPFLSTGTVSRSKFSQFGAGSKHSLGAAFGTPFLSAAPAAVMAKKRAQAKATPMSASKRSC